MSFHSINEIDRFSFEDCVIHKISAEEGGLCLELEAVIVRPTNSQNTNYTESYAGPMTVHLTEGQIVQVIKEGYTYLDANDKPIEEVPDVELSEKEIEALLKICVGNYWYGMEQKSFENGVYTYVCGLEMQPEEIYDTSAADTYRFIITFTKAEFVWQYYLNRVQR